MDTKQNNLVIETELTNRIKYFGEQISRIVTEGK